MWGSNLINRNLYLSKSPQISITPSSDFVHYGSPNNLQSAVRAQRAEPLRYHCFFPSIHKDGVFTFNHSGCKFIKNKMRLNKNYFSLLDWFIRLHHFDIGEELAQRSRHPTLQGRF